MQNLLRRISGLLLLLLLLTSSLAACGGLVPSGSNRHNVPLSNAAVSKLASMGSSPSEPMMIRIFKETSELEVWKRTKTGAYKLFSSYLICSWSGGLGPKIKEGDRQSPEGFYTITPALLNPKSSYYLSFNTGFPNKFDRAYGRTGSELMVHGDCTSRGCYAMTDEQIKEIYALARESFEGGNPSFQLELYPFRMTAQNLARHAADPNMPFWQNIKDGYDRFELSKSPPTWDVCNREYVFGVPEGLALNAAGACPAEAIVRTAALDQKQAADLAAMQTEVAAIAKRERDAAEAEERAAIEQAAIAERSKAVSGFISGLIGGWAQSSGTVDPTLVAPKPMPRIKRS
jgi:murein L,D-transpeptidase YafK